MFDVKVWSIASAIILVLKSSPAYAEGNPEISARAQSTAACHIHAALRTIHGDATQKYIETHRSEIAQAVCSLVPLDGCGRIAPSDSSRKWKTNAELEAEIRVTAGILLSFGC